MSNSIGDNKMTSVLREVALAVTGSFDLDTLLQRIVQTCIKSSRASRAALFLYEESTKQLVMRAESGNHPILRFNAKYLVEVDDITKIGLTAYVFINKKILVLNSPDEIVNHTAHRGKFDDKQYPGKQKCQSWVGIPLISPDSNNPIGVLKIENTIDRKPTRTFSEDEINEFKVIADIASSAIYKFQHQFSRINTSIEQLSKALVQDKGTLHDRLRLIVQTFKEISHADGASIWLKYGDRLVCESGVGHYEGMEGQAEYDLSCEIDTAEQVGLTAWIAVTGEPLNIKSNAELTSHPQHKGTFDTKNYPKPKSKKCESFIGAPLRIGKHIIGVMKADNRIPDSDHEECFFTEEEAQIFSYLSLITAIVVQNVRNFDKSRVYERKLLNLYKISAECGSIEDVKTILWLLLVGLTSVEGIGFRRAILFDYYEDAEICVIGNMARESDAKPESFSKGQKQQEQSGVYLLPEFNGDSDKTMSSIPAPSKLQSLVDGRQLKLEKDKAISTLAKSRSLPRVQFAEIDDLSFDVFGFLSQQNFAKIDGSKFIFFVIPNDDGNKIVGFCDVPKSSFENIDLRIRETETFLKQISLSISRISLKRTDAEMRQRAWKEFSASTAHRIGTETADLSGAIRGISREISNIKNDRLSSLMSRCKSALERMKLAVREYTEFVRPPKMDLKQVNINDIIRKVDRNLTSEGIDRVTIRLELDPNIPKIIADSGSLEYAFTEIIHNSLKEQDVKSINIFSSWHAESKKIGINFEDDGKGIREDFLDKVFDTGFKAREKGTGLGLSIVRDTITQHNGKVSASNVSGRGAKFSIELPGTPYTVWNKILIVDDNDNLRSDIRNELVNLLPGVKIHEAQNEFIALQLMKNHDFDCIITDIKLEESGGTEFGGFRVLEKGREKFPEAKIIVVTAHQALTYYDSKKHREINVLEYAKENGADHCIPRLQAGVDFIDSILDIFGN